VLFAQAGSLHPSVARRLEACANSTSRDRMELPDTRPQGYSILGERRGM